MEAVVEYPQTGNGIPIIQTAFEDMAFTELQQQGISCSNHNLVSAIIAAAQNYSVVHPPTSHSVQGGSVVSPGLISARIVSQKPEQRSTTKIQIKITACGAVTTCDPEPFIRGSSPQP